MAVSSRIVEERGLLTPPLFATEALILSRKPKILVRKSFFILILQIKYPQVQRTAIFA
jgi:hypothetical protein